MATAKIRIGNTIDIAVKVLTNGAEESLEGRDIFVRLVYPKGMAKDVTDWYLDVEDPTIIHFTIEGREQIKVGVYGIEVWENKDGISQAIFDQDIFELVSKTSAATANDKSNIVRPQINISGASLNVGGKDGVGIASISFVEHTAQGNKYEILLTNGTRYYFIARDGERGLKGDKGDKGESVYVSRVYQNYDYIGGIQYVMEFSDGRAFPFVAPRGYKGDTGIGEKGDKGDKGEKGEKGDTAYQPFKGWFSSLNLLNQTFPRPAVGDYAYVENDPVIIYECVTAGTWSESESTFNPANNQEFASGEGLNTVHIIDTLVSDSATDVLSAGQGKKLYEYIQAMQYPYEFILGKGETNYDSETFNFVKGRTYLITIKTGTSSSTTAFISKSHLNNQNRQAFTYGNPFVCNDDGYICLFTAAISEQATWSIVEYGSIIPKIKELESRIAALEARLG